MIKTASMLLEELSSYSNAKMKLSRMVKEHQCFPVRRGLYETDKTVSPYLLAGSIYGPSYISFEFALSFFYSIIPERVYKVTNATCQKQKKKYMKLFILEHLHIVMSL